MMIAMILCRGDKSPNMSDPLTSPYVLPLLFFFHLRRQLVMWECMRFTNDIFNFYDDSNDNMPVETSLPTCLIH